MTVRCQIADTCAFDPTCGRYSKCVDGPDVPRWVIGVVTNRARRARMSKVRKALSAARAAGKARGHAARMAKMDHEDVAEIR